ncbi:MAG: TetR/AcrR family transcriptional regulator [Acidobacteria bacterium]|nr:TetR/AcrR family transcriptional regulator [Acidobacteriota bacterium]
MPAASVTKGALTRDAILAEAVQMASELGLEGLSIGRLAEVTGLSKAGLFAHFGSKEELQLATLRAVRDRVALEVFVPAFKAPRGLKRLVAVCDRWLAYAESGVFRGGCPIAAASAEFDGRPGPVKAYTAECMAELRQTLARLIREAKATGELAKEADPGQLAFEFHALVLGANGAFQLFDEQAAFAMSRRAIKERLRAYVAPGTRLAPL